MVKIHRTQANLTQLELAQLASVGKTVVFDIEHAKPTVQLNSILGILEVLNIRLQLVSPLNKDKMGEAS